MNKIKWFLAKINILLIIIWVTILFIIVFPIFAILGLVLGPNSLWRGILADWFVSKIKQYSEYVVYYSIKNPYTTKEQNDEFYNHYKDLWNE